MNIQNAKKFLKKLSSPKKYSKRVILVRHGQSWGNKSDIISGALDHPLTPVGVMQSKILHSILQESIPELSGVRTSNLMRSLETCQIAMGFEKGNMMEQVIGVGRSEGNWVLQKGGELLASSGNDSFQISDGFEFVDSLGTLKSNVALYYNEGENLFYSEVCNFLYQVFMTGVGVFGL